MRKSFCDFTSYEGKSQTLHFPRMVKTGFIDLTQITAELFFNLDEVKSTLEVVMMFTIIKKKGF